MTPKEQPLVEILEKEGLRVLQDVRSPHEIILIKNEVVIINPQTVKLNSVGKLLEKIRQRKALYSTCRKIKGF